MRILRLDEVKSKTGLSKSAIYSRVSQGTFPRPRALGPKASGWVESEIDKWIETRPIADDRTLKAVVTRFYASRGGSGEIRND